MDLEPLHICLNGHVESQQDEFGPYQQTPFCQECGDPIVSQCQSCKKALPIPDEFDLQPSPPVHCGHCGQPHEWTRRKKQAAIELFVEDVGDNEDAQNFAAEIEHISRDTPKAQLAAVRINKLLGKITTGTASLIRDIFVGIASAAISDQLRINK